jgi:solute carrier family 15 oligopeptide transporter 1
MSNTSDKMSTTEKTFDPMQYTLRLRYTSPTAPEGRYDELGKIEVASGGNYVLSVARNHTNMNGSAGHIRPYIIGLNVVTRPNSVHILWLLPQYIIITVAEIMFSITGLEFSYSQAPTSMKAVVASAWLLTVAFGNIIVVAIVQAHFFDEQSKELFLYAGLMFVDMLLFAWMAYCYKPREIQPELSAEEVNGNISMKKTSMDNDGFEDEAI